MNKSPEPAVAEADQLVTVLLQTAHAVESRLERILGEADLSLAKLGVLRELATAGEPVSLCQLAERLSCVRSNITQLIDRLEKDGLVRRQPDPDDRRGVLAALTARGERVCESGRRLVTREQEIIAGSLGDRDVAALRDALESLSA